MTISRICTIAVFALLCTPAAGRDDKPGTPPQKSAQANQSVKKPAFIPPPATPDGRGEWRINGPSFICIVTWPNKQPPKDLTPETLANACLYMGPFGIGRDAKTVAAALGPPHRTLPQPNEAMANLYFLEAADRMPYLIVTTRKDKIIALQVSGAATSKDYTFNHIKLGDDTATLVKYFGAARQVSPSAIKDTEQWSYGPWPFSFEVKGGRVTSVRIVDSAQ
jgi:hypothetical protein